MTTTDLNNEYQLRISKTISAPIEDAFTAWTDAEQVSKWFAPQDNFTTIVPNMDVRVGGKYCIEMHEPEGKIHIVSGEYVEVSKPNRLVFTWSWAHEGNQPTMLVTIELTAKGDQTELTLTHERLPSAESRDHHNDGWTACLGRLLKMMNG